jgi:hypothetical protein
MPDVTMPMVVCHVRLLDTTSVIATLGMIMNRPRRAKAAVPAHTRGSTQTPAHDTNTHTPPAKTRPQRRARDIPLARLFVCFQMCFTWFTAHTKRATQTRWTTLKWAATTPAHTPGQRADTHPACK